MDIFPLQVSPFLPVQTGPVGYMLQYRTPDAAQRMTWGFDPFTEGVAVANVEEAEDRYLARAHVTTEIWDASDTLKYAHQPFTRSYWLSCAIRRQAAAVAARGRRGYANVALMHPDMTEQIGMDNFVDSEHFIGGGTMVGRWTRVGELPKWDNIGSTIYCSQHLPLNEVWVIYVKEPMDAGGILVENDGQYTLMMQAVDMMTGPQQYITRIHFYATIIL